MELLSQNPPLELGDPDWPILTCQPQAPPARFAHESKNANIDNVMVSGGCRIPEYSAIGFDPAQDRERYHVTDGGVAVVTRMMLGDGPAWLMKARYRR